MSPILLAVTGLSPAIVTETLWALAAEKPRVLPRRVQFITTAVGAQKLREQLFTPLPSFGGKSVWQALREALGAGDHELIAEEPRIIGSADKKSGTLKPLDDIQTPAENDIAASFILEEVRRIVENPDLQLIASIAGGRKTMGALLHAAVSLIGRETDRLTHVLVSAPYDSLPGFFFPSQPGGTVTDRAGTAYNPAKAKVQLADVPFVPLRNRFKELDEMPGTFDGMVAKFSQQFKQDAARPAQIQIDYRRKLLAVDAKIISMRPKALAVLHFLCWMQEKKIPITASQSELADGLSRWLPKQKAIPAGYKIGPMDETTWRHELSHLRVTLKKAGTAWNLPTRFTELPPFGLTLAEP